MYFLFVIIFVLDIYLIIILQHHGERKGYRMKVSRPYGACDCTCICTGNCYAGYIGHYARYGRDEIYCIPCNNDDLFFTRGQTRRDYMIELW
ncbi:hypothetical protein PUN28_005184 [Cardiocondyla obscurior]|uniref:Uncharacterized protein n=1 Tax=Cardiocondyla obscurior TaxID=286306 RepID=A0AAW2GEL3_9HYME